MQYIYTLLAYSEGKLGIDQEHRHKGLKKFFNSGGNDTRGINSDHADKLRDQLAALDSLMTLWIWICRGGASLLEGKG